MEAVRYFIPCEDEGQVTNPAQPTGVEACLDLLQPVSAASLDGNRNQSDAAAVTFGRAWLIPNKSDPRSRV